MRNFDLYILRYMPYPLRDDFVTIGFALVEENGWFSDFRMTKDWRNLQCLDPGIDLERFEILEAEMRKQLQVVLKQKALSKFVSENFGPSIYVAPAKGIRTENPVREIELLTSQHLGIVEGVEGSTRSRTGRRAIIYKMHEAFLTAGVLELLQTEMDMGKYIGRHDPFRMDFGYRAGGVVKMFHAVSMATNVDQALALLCRYSEIEVGMQQEQLGASLTAVVELGLSLQDDRNQFALDKLRQHSIRVKTLRDMTDIANEVRADFRM